MKQEEVEKIEVVVKLTLAKLEIIKLKYSDHGYKWSLIKPEGQQLINDTLISIDEMLQKLQPAT